MRTAESISVSSALVRCDAYACKRGILETGASSDAYHPVIPLVLYGANKMGLIKLYCVIHSFRCRFRSRSATRNVSDWPVVDGDRIILPLLG